MCTYCRLSVREADLGNCEIIIVIIIITTIIIIIIIIVVVASSSYTSPPLPPFTCQGFVFARRLMFVALAVLCSMCFCALCFAFCIFLLRLFCFLVVVRGCTCFVFICSACVFI